MMRIVAVIPARYGSERLPGKPLLRAGGKYLVQHVWEGVNATPGLAEVLIATDDARIRDAAASFGARAVLTRPDHPSGTDRVFEAVESLGQPPDVILNVQGDEPGVGAAEIRALVRLLEERPEADISTLVCPMGPEAGADPARVKVVLDGAGCALYFSRAPIPFMRSGAEPSYLVHVGMYGYRRAALKRFVRLPPSPLELTERLEQLRGLEAGMKIAVDVVAQAPAQVDTMADYEAFLRTLGDGKATPG